MAAFIDNKAILKNSIFLYVRMFVLMAVSFFTVRIVLQALGVEDYGIYNVVGGIVAMFQFISGSLTSSSQRYFSIEIANGNEEKLNQVFRLNITVYVLIGVVIIAVAETIGLWFLNNKLIIPAGRMTAANVVFQLSIISFIFTLLSIPYNALIVAYERMSAFAWIGLVEGIAKLFVALMILYSPAYKLILYAALMTVLSILVTYVYIRYCRKNFICSRYKWTWNKNEAGELFSFSGWHFLGTFSVVIRSNGINLLINMFFNPAVNAARAIGYQVENVLFQFSNNYFTAVKPQMYKAYGVGEMEGLFTLINRSTILSMYLISVFFFPLIINLPFIINLWLGEIPEYTIAFGSLAIINCLIDSTSSPMIAPMLAYGRIRNFEIAISLTAILNLPVSYLALRFGYSPQSTVWVSIFFSIVSIFVRLYFLGKNLHFPVVPYLWILVKTAILSVVIFFFIYNVSLLIPEDWIRLILTSILSLIMVTLAYLIVASKDDRRSLILIVRSKFRH